MSLNKNVVPRPHQESAVNKLVERDGSLLMSHAVGSGKTLTALVGFQKLRDQGKAKRTLIVTPASLRENFAKDGVEKFTNDKYVIFGNKQEAAGPDKRMVDVDKYKGTRDIHHIVSYDLFKRDPKKYIEKSKADTVIYDELHRAKNETAKLTDAIKEARPLHRNFIGLTGSIVSNSPTDMVPLIDAMTSGKHTLGSKAAFESRFLNVGSKGRKEVKNKRVVKALTSPYIDHVEVEDLKIAAPPKKIIKNHDIVMSPVQSDMYRYALDKLDIKTKAKLKLGVGKIKDSDLKAIANKLMAARQASNAPHTIDKKLSLATSLKESSKASRLIADTVKHIKSDPNHQVLIGTQFIKGGVDVLSYGLKKNNIPFDIFVGKGNKGVTESSRQEAVNKYNSGKARALIISGAGGEGLNLPNTTMINMMDGHFNPEVVNQMEARGIRSGGLAHLPEKDRKVTVNRYRSVPDIRIADTAMNVLDAINPSTYIKRILNDEKVLQNPVARDFSADKFIEEIAKNKEQNNSEIKGLFKASALLRTDSEVMSNYYDNFENKLPGVVGTDNYIDEKEEKKYIETLRKTYEDTAKAKNFIKADPKDFKYNKDDFGDEGKGKLKLLSYLDSNKNKHLASTLLLGGAVGGLYGISPAIKIGSQHHNPKAAAIALGVATALGTVGTGIASYLGQRNADFGTMVKAQARRKSKLKDHDLLRLLRGENVSEVVEKKIDHFIK